MDSIANNNSEIVKKDSYFDGNTFQLIGYRILFSLVCVVTLGIAYPWMLCMLKKWEVKHTVINGRRLKFSGQGHQLIGKYLLWVLLTIVTVGVYGIWLGLSVKKWVVKHTVYDDEQETESYFSGGAGGFLGIHVFRFLFTICTLGIGKAWADKMLVEWEMKHTHIGGSPLEFSGRGGQLFGKYLLLALLTPLTLGVYALFFTVIYMKWEVKHTDAVYQLPEVQLQAKAHELTAIQDFAKYRIAANDMEIAAMKSGYTGNESIETLEQLVGQNNPFASYHLARVLKGEAPFYEGRALELLQKAADFKNHFALLDFAKQLPIEQAIPMFIEAAQYGNAEASWILAVEYMKLENLTDAAYWFKVAMEWGVPEALNYTDSYNQILNNIAIQLAQVRPMPQMNKALIIVVSVIGALVLFGGIATTLMLLPARYEPKEMYESVQNDSYYNEPYYNNNYYNDYNDYYNDNHTYYEEPETESYTEESNDFVYEAPSSSNGLYRGAQAPYYFFYDESLEGRVETKKDPLNLRKGPSKSDERITGIPKGKYVRVLGTNTDSTNKSDHTWLFVEYKGKYGWVLADYLNW